MLIFSCLNADETDDADETDFFGIVGFWINCLDLRHYRSIMYKYLLLFFSTFAFGQTPFSQDNLNNTLALKACAYVHLLDGGYGSILGVEETFLKNHSIGGKFIYNEFTPHRESSEELEPIDYTINKDVSLILEYKYYFNSFSESNGLLLYSSLSYKRGRNTIDNDYNYPHDFYHREINYSYIGPALGAVVFLSPSKRWTIDTQIGYLIGKKNSTTTYEVPDRHDLEESHGKKYFRFEIMLAYNINWK